MTAARIDYLRLWRGASKQPAPTLRREKASRIARFFALENVEDPPSYDLRNLSEGLQRSVWLAAVNYRLAFSLASLGFRVVDAETREERTDAKAKQVRKVLRQPNPEESYFEFLVRNFIHLGTVGEAYLEKEINGLGKTVALHSWHPHRVTPIRDESGKRRVAAYRFAVGGEFVTLPAELVIPIVVYNPDNELRGFTMVAPMWDDLVGDQNAARYNKTLLRRGARIGGILEMTEGDPGDEEMARLRAAFNARQSGPENSGQPLVLPPGLKYQRDAITARDMDFLNLRKFAREIAAGAYGVPPMLIGNFDSASYANAKEQLRSFWDYVAKPHLKHFLGELNERWVHPEIGEDIDIEVDLAQIDALVDAQTTRVDNAAKKLTSGAITINEARKELGYPAVPDGDRFLVPVNLAQGTPDNLAGSGAPEAEGDPAAPAATEPEEPQGTQDVEVAEAAVLNGAQISAAFAIVAAVAAGEIPRDSGSGALVVMFNLTPEQAEQIMGSAGKPEVPTTPNPKPAGAGQPEPQGGQQPPPGADDDQEDEEEPEDKKAFTNRLRRLGLLGKARVRASGRAVAREAHEHSLRRAEGKVVRAAARYLAGARERVVARLRTQGDVVDVDFVVGNPEVEARLAAEVLVPAMMEVLQESGDLTMARLGLQRRAAGSDTWVRKADAPDRVAELLQLLEAFSLGNPRVLAYLEQHFLVHLEDLTKDTLRDLERTLQSGLAAGEGIAELAVRVASTPAFSPLRAERIARTETIGVLNLGAQEAFRAAGTPRKSWLSARDERVRESHVSVDARTAAQPIPVDAHFELAEPGRGSARLMFPGDPEGPAWAAVNCRCSLVPEDEEQLAYWVERCKEELGLSGARNGVAHAR